MSRTTIDLDDAVLRELKQRRAREGKSLGVIASELLARALREDPAPTPSLEWTAHAMGAFFVYRVGGCNRRIGFRSRGLTFYDARYPSVEMPGYSR